MLACEASTGEEISYNPAISTCKMNHQCPETYRAAERQCVRSGDLKPAGAKTAHLKPMDVNEVLAARDTIEYAEDKIDHDALNPRSSSGTSWTGTDGPSIPDTPGPRVGGRRFAGPGGTTLSLIHI